MRKDHKTVYRVRTGSFLYGLNTPESDEDFNSIIMPRPEDLLGLQKLEEIDNSTKGSEEKRRNTSEDVDDKAFTLNRFIHLIMGGNPEKIETLFAQPHNIFVDSEIIQFVKDHKDRFISNRIIDSFSGFAFSQKSKLIVKKERYSSIIKGIEYLESLGSDRLSVNNKFTQMTEEEAVFLNKTIKYYKGTKNNTESFHSGLPLNKMYEMLVHERDNYGWRVKTKTFETLGYDIKFGYHLLRLQQEAYDLITTGKIEYPFVGKPYEDIMSVRKGEVDYNRLMEMYDEYDEKVKSIIGSSVLRDKPDFNFVNDWLVKTTLDHFKKF